MKKNDLPWPQFFSPKGKDASLIQGLGQPGPPAHWLVGQNSVLVGVNAYQKLGQKVKRLLAAQPAAAAAAN